jgi:hypothetical protein
MEAIMAITTYSDARSSTNPGEAEIGMKCEGPARNSIIGRVTPAVERSIVGRSVLGFDSTVEWRTPDPCRAGRWGRVCVGSTRPDAQHGLRLLGAIALGGRR